MINLDILFRNGFQDIITDINISLEEMQGQLQSGGEFLTLEDKNNNFHLVRLEDILKIVIKEDISG